MNKKTLSVNGDIGAQAGAVSLATVERELIGGPFDELTVRINSRGGSPTEAVAMYHAIREASRMVVTHCTGCAYSAGSLLFMVGDRRVMNQASMLMIHGPSVGISGTTRDLSRASELLAKMEAEYARIYSSRSGQSLDAVATLMEEDTYLTAKEAVEMGFATEISGEAAMHLPASENDFALDTVAMFGTKSPTQEQVTMAVEYGREYDEFAMQCKEQRVSYSVTKEAYIRSRFNDIDGIPFPKQR